MPHCAAVAVSLLVIASGALAGGSTTALPGSKQLPERFPNGRWPTPKFARDPPPARRQYLHHGDCRATASRVSIPKSQQIQRMGPSLRRASARLVVDKGARSGTRQRQRHHPAELDPRRQGAEHRAPRAGARIRWCSTTPARSGLPASPGYVAARSLRVKNRGSTACRADRTASCRQSRQRLGVAA